MKKYTPELLRKFDRLTLDCSSLNNFTRISARLELKRFEAEHGKDVCQEMFEVLKKRDEGK